MFTLDTNTLIYFFKDLGNVAQELSRISPKDLSIPAVVLYELEYGITRSMSPDKRRKQLGQLTRVIEILPFNDAAAQQSASIRALLEQKGTPIGPHDTLIAGTALAHHKVLITNNTKEFSRVEALKIENWY